MDICSNCGAPLGDGQAFCSKCGTPRAVSKRNICPQCGTELQEDHVFCPKCGTKADTVNAAVNRFDAGMQQIPVKKNRIPLIICIAAAATVLVAVIAFLAGGTVGGEKGPGFQQLYDQYCLSIWADVGSDGSYLSIDTNPYDKDDSGLAYPAAYVAVKEVNKALELPESVITEMSETTGADGKLYFNPNGSLLRAQFVTMLCNGVLEVSSR